MPNRQKTKTVSSNSLFVPSQRTSDLSGSDSEIRTPVVTLYPYHALSEDRQTSFSAYHQFVTKTYLYFGKEHPEFWRDHVAGLAWRLDIVFEAIIALGSIDRAGMLTREQLTKSEGMELKIIAMSSYANVLQLLSAMINQKEERQTIIVVLILLTYFECFTNNPRSAMRHLWAAQRLFQKLADTSYGLARDTEPIWSSLTRLDFLAQCIVPYAQSSLLRTIGSTNTLSVELALPFCHDEYQKERLHPLALERARLVHLISTFNNAEKIVWAPWYDAAVRPSKDTLLQFQAELIRWKNTSLFTFPNANEDDHDITAAKTVALHSLSIPPAPKQIGKHDAAINAAIFNTYMACSLAMLSAHEEYKNEEAKVFWYVYQNLCIAESLTTANDNKANFVQDLDIGICLPLYLGFRRCYSESWQRWTISKLLQIGQEGLYDGHAFANTLQILRQVQAKLEMSVYTNTGCASSPLGPLNERIVPLLLPKDDDGTFHAYFAKPLTGNLDSATKLPVAAKASWTTNTSGNIVNLTVHFFDNEAPAEGQMSLDAYLAWRRSVESGWHKFLYIP